MSRRERAHIRIGRHATAVAMSFLAVLVGGGVALVAREAGRSGASAVERVEGRCFLQLSEGDLRSVSRRSAVELR